jgi:hypothetical protein
VAIWDQINPNKSKKKENSKKHFFSKTRYFYMKKKVGDHFGIEKNDQNKSTKRHVINSLFLKEQLFVTSQKINNQIFKIARGYYKKI